MNGKRFRSTAFEIEPYRAEELVAEDIPALQAFFVDNPEYFIAVNGEPPQANEAEEEFFDQVPSDMSYTRIFRIGFFSNTGKMIGMTSVVADLNAYRVWHIALFIIATSLHGSGVATAIHDAMLAWMRQGGAAWVRLGVVEGNVRAERFWQRRGYHETRKRCGVQMGAKVNTLRVMVKSLAGDALQAYLEGVPRDHPE